MRTVSRLLAFAVSLTLLGCVARADAPLILRGGSDGAPLGVGHATPLETLVVEAPAGGSLEVRDGDDRVYFSSGKGGWVSFLAGGALGQQKVVLRDGSGAETSRATFELDAETSVDDGGKYGDMFTLFHNGMSADVPGGVDVTTWNGRTYHFFVTWVLDNYHTGKGMKYFSPYGTDFVEMMRSAQREDGMIWSNINPGQAVAYYKTAYGPFDYIRRIGDRYFVRQPAENHPEYVYVSTIYQTWKTHGDDRWMSGCLASAKRAMDYCMTDPARWSDRYQLLKRVYTIDSWDFQVDDAYTPDIGLSKTMLVDAKKSKFGVFFGDNVYYAASCDELAEMLAHSGDPAGAAAFTTRAADIRRRLDALSWNGRFYTHFIDEDPTVKRDLGVDEKTQVAQGNAYALNRGVSGEHAVAIIKTYMDLRQNLPAGSPGEWYAIYPPFGKGFGLHDQEWQYMNGGVGGHVAGELARGAFENGYERARHPRPPHGPRAQARQQDLVRLHGLDSVPSAGARLQADRPLGPRQHGHLRQGRPRIGSVDADGKAGGRHPRAPDGQPGLRWHFLQGGRSRGQPEEGRRRCVTPPGPARVG